jgi:hypothetical protein
MFPKICFIKREKLFLSKHFPPGFLRAMHAYQLVDLVGEQQALNGKYVQLMSYVALQKSWCVQLKESAADGKAVQMVPSRNVVRDYSLPARSAQDASTREYHIQCSVCNTSESLVLACDKCLTTFTCSAACATAHMRAGHKACLPMAFNPRKVNMPVKVVAHPVTMEKVFAEDGQGPMDMTVTSLALLALGYGLLPLHLGRKVGITFFTEARPRGILVGFQYGAVYEVDHTRRTVATLRMVLDMVDAIFTTTDELVMPLGWSKVRVEVHELVVPIPSAWESTSVKDEEASKKAKDKKGKGKKGRR